MKAFIAMVTLLLTLSFSVASPNKASASDPTPEQIQATLDILRTLPDNPALTAVVGVLQARLDAAHPTEPLPNNLQQAAHRYDCNTCSLRSGLPPELIDQENIISICGCKRIIVKSADDSKLAFLKVRISAAADQNIFNSNIRPGEQADILVPVYQGRAIANVAILAYYGYKGVGKTKDEVNRKLVRRPLVSTNIDLANLTHELQNTKIYNNTLLRNTLAIEVTGNRHQQIITNLTREEQVVTSRNYVANRDIAHEDRQSTRGPRFFGLIHNYDATIFNIGRMTARTVINGLYITGQLYHKYYGSGTNSSHTVNQSKDKTSIDSIGVERYVNNAIKSRYEGETWSSRINKGTTHVERVSLPINEIVGNNGRVHVAFFLENQGKHNKHSVKGIRGRKVAFKSRAFSSAGDNNSYNEYWAVAGIQNDNGKKKQFEKFMGRHGALAGDSEYSTNGMITKDLPSYLYEPKVPKIYRLKQGSTHSNPINDLRARPVLNTTNATITLVDPASGEAPANNSQSATANNAQQAVALAFGAQRFAANQKYDCAKCTMRGSHQGPSGADRQAIMESCGCKSFAINIVDPNLRIRSNISSAGAERIVNSTRGGYFGVLVPTAADGSAMVRVKLENVTTSTAKTVIDTNIDLREGNVSFRLPVRPGSPASYLAHTDRYDCSKCKVLGSSGGSSPSNADKNNMMNVCGCKKLAVTINPIPGVQTVRVNTRSRGDENLHNYNANITNGKSFSILVPRDARGKAMNHLKVEAMEGANQYRTLIDEHVDLAEEAEGNTYTVTIPENGQSASGPESDQAEGTPQQAFNGSPSYSAAAPAAAAVDVATTTAKYDCARCKVRSSSTGSSPSGADKTAMIELCGCKRLAVNIAPIPGVQTVKVNTQSRGDENLHNVNYNITNGKSFSILVPRDEQGIIMVHLKVEAMEGQNQYRTLIDQHLNLAQETQSGTHTVSLPEQDTQSSTGSSAAPNNNNNQTSQDNNNQTSQDNNNRPHKTIITRPHKTIITRPHKTIITSLLRLRRVFIFLIYSDYIILQRSLIYISMSKFLIGVLLYLALILYSSLNSSNNQVARKPCPSCQTHHAMQKSIAGYHNH